MGQGVIRARVASGKGVGLAPRSALVPGCSGTRSIVPDAFSRFAGEHRKLSTALSMPSNRLYQTRDCSTSTVITRGRGALESI